MDTGEGYPSLDSLADLSHPKETEVFVGLARVRGIENAARFSRGGAQTCP
jgi:hypothetical protein